MKSLVTSFVQFVYRLRHGITLSNAKYETLVEAVNAQSNSTSELSDAELKTHYSRIHNSVNEGAALDDVAVEAFALIREAAKRSLSMRPYDVQVLAAFAMNTSKCVEMQTGEGKTLAAAMTISLRALTGHGVHVLTFNDYLSERDAQWMRPVYDFLGLSVGHVKEGMSQEDRQTAYNSDITYLTAKEAAFDFLRDQLCTQPKDRVQRHFHFAIIDEADSILIDEARIPMVIATEAERDETDLHKVATFIRPLQRGMHYQIKTSGRNISFTESGLRLLERQLGVAELHSEENIELLTRLNLALHAEVLLTKDIDYIVRNDAIELIDEFTGRVAENRKWPGGLQAALEAREGLEIQPQGRILNSITLQQFLEMYDRLAGMTGTAVEATEELDEFYKLKVVLIPPNRPCIRIDHTDRIFRTKKLKFAALAEEIRIQHETGRPVLIGTASVNESEQLAQQLLEAGVHCRVLNAANDHLEAEIIADAGALNAVTISTNMAGRGTDICLGGSDPDTQQRIVAMGGLYVIGTNRHESRRIDNQLRGRSGRQGDPGESRFFVSLEDDLLSRHGIAELVTSQSTNSSKAIDDEATAKKIGHLQRIIEGECFEIRGTLRKYSILLELQRRTLSQHREELLNGTRTPDSLREKNPDFREQLVQQWGEQSVADAERDVSLIHIDWCWSDHLTHAAEIREGIHLVSFGGFNAFDTFNKEMNIEFQTYLADVQEKVVETMTTATFTEDGIDLEEAGLRGPSSTWTFTINDNPRGAVLGQLLRGAVSRIRTVLS
jgi:preprotein translocase subunit SecA